MIAMNDKPRRAAHKKITPDKVAQAKRLFEAGHSIRKIATKIGIGRHTVRAIVMGNYDHEDVFVRSPTGVYGDRGFPWYVPTATDPRLKRCGSCGGKVIMPCKLCQVRSLKKSRENH